MPSAPQTELIRTRVEEISTRNPAYAELCTWVGDILVKTVEHGGEPAAMSVDPAGLDSPTRMAQGRSLLDLTEMEFDWQRAAGLLEALLEAVDSGQANGSQVAGLRPVLAKGVEEARELFASVLANDYPALERAGDELGVEPSVLALLLRLALRPQLLALAEAMAAKVDYSVWRFGHCPLCGSAPALASLEGEGGRVLHCSLCETSWSYPRLRCPFCENDEFESLGYLKAEGEEGLRADFCAKCGHYLKTIDLREMSGPVIVPLDDAATSHLDMIAVKELKGE